MRGLQRRRFRLLSNISLAERRSIAMKLAAFHGDRQRLVERVVVVLLLILTDLPMHPVDARRQIF